jgi:hypothetical protein
MSGRLRASANGALPAARHISTRSASFTSPPRTGIGITRAAGALVAVFYAEARNRHHPRSPDRRARPCKRVVRRVHPSRSCAVFKRAACDRGGTCNRIDPKGMGSRRGMVRGMK